MYIEGGWCYELLLNKYQQVTECLFHLCRTKNAPTMTIVRHSEHQGQSSQRQEELPYIPEVSVKERLRVRTNVPGRYFLPLFTT